MNTNPGLAARFIDVAGQRLLLTTVAPSDPITPKGAICVVQPFAEELNRARNPVRRFAEAAAQQGWTTYVVDLSGTGDSSGVFQDARLATWRRELSEVVNQLFDPLSSGMTTALLAIRSGALLLTDLDIRQKADRIVLWQPITTGKKWLREFLRIYSMRAMATASDAPARKPAVVLEEDGHIEVAGYWLTQAMANDIEAQQLAINPTLTAHVDILDIGGEDVSAASKKFADAVAANEMTVSTGAVAVQPFWRIQEPVDTSALSAATLALLDTVNE